MKHIIRMSALDTNLWMELWNGLNLHVEKQQQTRGNCWPSLSEACPAQEPLCLCPGTFQGHISSMGDGSPASNPRAKRSREFLVQGRRQPKYQGIRNNSPTLFQSTFSAQAAGGEIRWSEQPASTLELFWWVRPHGAGRWINTQANSLFFQSTSSKKPLKSKPAATDIIGRCHEEIQHSPALALILPTSRNLNVLLHSLFHKDLKKNPRLFSFYNTWSCLQTGALKQELLFHLLLSIGDRNSAHDALLYSGKAITSHPNPVCWYSLWACSLPRYKFLPWCCNQVTIQAWL